MITEWQRVEWNDDEDVSAPEFLVKQSATWPVLVRFESFDGTVSKNVTNRYSLFGEEPNYKSVMVAPVVWPVEVQL
jgi:hypothetical protein